MTKNLLKELILPSFWLFFFLVSPKNEGKIDQLKKEDNIGVKRQETKAAGIKNKEATKEATFTNAVYLSGF